MKYQSIVFLGDNMHEMSKPFVKTYFLRRPLALNAKPILWENWEKKKKLFQNFAFLIRPESSKF